MDITSGDANVSYANLADSRVSLAGLFFRSNVVGFAVSAEWLLIEANFNVI